MTPPRRPLRTVLLMLAGLAVALLSAACLGRGNGNSTGAVQSAQTAPATNVAAAGDAFTQECGNAITPAQAVTRQNESVTVAGPVVAATYDQQAQDAPTYIEIGAKYPDPNSLSIVVLGATRGRFPSPPETLYDGKTICVIGVVTTYQQRHAIIVGSASEIAVK